jgi:ATP-binding cassette subfamily E protein 1
VREGINIFLDGFIPTENLRFRETSMSFRLMETLDDDSVEHFARYSYPSMSKARATPCRHVLDFS